MKVPACKVVALGEISPWGKQFITAMHNENLIEVSTEASVAKFCEANSGQEARIAFIENVPESRQWITKIRSSTQRVYLIWFGRTFSRDDLVYAHENRVYQVFENLRPEDKKILDTLTRLAAAVEHIREYEQIARSLKAILLQAEPELSKPLLNDIKVAIVKLERHAMQNEFMSLFTADPDAEMKLPFHKTDGFSDALATVQELERTGVLWLRGKLGGEDGKVEFLQGKIVGATTGDVRGLKAIYRMFLWDEPKFMFTRRDPETLSIDEELNVGLRFIIREGLNHKQRFENIRRELPPFDLRLELEPSALHAGTTIPTMYFSTLASVVEFGKVAQIVDFSPLPDVMVFEALIKLRKENMIRVATT